MCYMMTGIARSPLLRQSAPVKMLRKEDNRLSHMQMLWRRNTIEDR